MAAPAEPQKKSPSSLTLRIISAAVLIPIVALAAYFGGLGWSFLIIIFAIVMMGEWGEIALTGRGPTALTMFMEHRQPRAVESAIASVIAALLLLMVGIQFAGQSSEFFGWNKFWLALAVTTVIVTLLAARKHRWRALWLPMGMLYVAVPCGAIMWLRADPLVGLQQILWIVALVIAADTGAYIAGRSIGGPKLAPRISPNKTWAGLGGAVVSAAVIGAITALLMDHPAFWTLTVVSGLLGIVAQAGDLAESAFKRHFGVKDASNIIPGHGGALDRVDGLIAVAAAVAGINVLIGSSVLTWL
jgi:phosphatidate cytidylyltransferase